MKSIYLYIVAATLILGWLLPQKGRQRITYILLITFVFTFISSFRYSHLTGDLMKYHHIFNTLADFGWGSDEVLQGGRNAGFLLFLKLLNHLSNADFQVVLIVIAVTVQAILAYMVYRYSPAPWISFLVWSCMAFFIFSMSSIKQAFAMAFVMLSFIGIIEKRLVYYLCIMTIAGFLHMPALVFLPAYWFCQLKMRHVTILMYVLLGIALYIFKDAFVDLISSIYYEEDEFLVYSGELGNRFLMILGFTMFGVLFTGFQDPVFEKLFHLMAIASILQMLAGYDNVFSRMADYYFQFSVLYLPFLFSETRIHSRTDAFQPIILFNTRSKKLLTVLLCAFLIWFYYTYNINVTIDYTVDDYLNYRFMWDVK